MWRKGELKIEPPSDFFCIEVVDYNGLMFGPYSSEDAAKVKAQLIKEGAPEDHVVLRTLEWRTP